MNKIVEVKQLPILDFSKMEEIGKEVEKKLAPYTSGKLVVTEDNRKDIKKLRSELRKEYTLAEDVRKEIRKQIEEPYKQFLEEYNKHIKPHYELADNVLKKALFEVEEELRNEKREEVVSYFNELKATEELDFLSFEQLDIKINLSSSVNKLKEEIAEKIGVIKSDLALINTQEHKERILVQYQQNLDVNRSITTVLNQVEQEERLAQERANKEALMKEYQEQQEKKEKEQEPQILTKPEVKKEEEKIYTMSFVVKGNIEQLKAVKEFLESNNIEYEGQ